MKCLYLAFALLAFAIGTGHAADQTLKLVVGQPATIELEENPSTGYSWTIDAQASSNLANLRIDDLGFSHNADGKRLVGAPGLHRWSVQATKPGNARVVFVYRRPWETSVARRHEVEVEATAQ
ncbi:protease inhibitor I42 family protein [Pseudorhodoplanes sp.]|jgi:inhibitor of cysteine peptidase|uniref:protease inhibitor I42 family protein n=1 Tax=Pseudorhodoplanes sp. TaxID=1934341 RepID=UPI002B5157D9|nr:protease inhibitor I42 family protein [Pseudorhodoplanes sp.]HWV40132.1 protease inhibitor I42 family protein [Pseudorhodoplanes sp.]